MIRISNRPSRRNSRGARERVALVSAYKRDKFSTYKAACQTQTLTKIQSQVSRCLEYGDQLTLPRRNVYLILILSLGSLTQKSSPGTQ